MAAYVPIPYRKPNRVICEYTKAFDDGAGHRADVTYLIYVDKKGKVMDEFTMYVRWKEQ